MLYIVDSESPCTNKYLRIKKICAIKFSSYRVRLKILQVFIDNSQSRVALARFGTLRGQPLRIDTYEYVYQLDKRLDQRLRLATVPRTASPETTFVSIG